MGTVKYTGPVASFHCPTNADIRSLKVHFSPKQEGTGDPSPENVRPIVGWDGVSIEHTKNNIAQFEPYGTGDVNLKWSVPKSILETDSLIRYSIYIDNSNGDSEACIRAAFFDINGNRLQSRTRLSGVPVGQSKRDYFTIQPFPSGTDYVVFGIKGNNFYIKEPMIDIFQKNAFKETPYEPYRGSTTNYTFGVLGKNKLSDDINDYTFNTPSHSTYSYTLNNGEFSATMPSGVRDYLVILGKEQYAPGTYTLSFDYVNGGGNTSWQPVIVQYTSSWYSSKVPVLANSTEGHIEKTFTCDVPFTVNLCLNSFNNTIQEGLNKIYNLQLELGPTATTYEPYNPNHTVYGGWVDLISGEVCEEWKLLHFVKNYFIGVVDMSGVNYAVSATIGNAAARRLFYCDKLNSTVMHISNDAPLNPPYDGLISSDKRLVFALPEEITTLEQVQDLIDDIGGFDVAYKIETPNAYSIAPTELQTFLGHNNVWSNADYVEVEYDLHETQDILARKQFIIANQPHIEEASGSIATFNTDMAAKLKECKVGFKPKQEGEGNPSPNNVRPISGWTGLTTYYSGENLYVPNPDNKGYINVSGVINVDATSTYTDLIPVTAGKTYSFKCTTAYVPEGTTNRRLHGYDSNGNWVMQITNRTTAAATVEDVSIVAAIPSNVSYIRVSFRNQDTNVRVAKEDVIGVNWSTEAGTVYGGYVDLITGEVWKTYHQINITELGTYRTLGINKNNNTQISWFLSNHLNAPEATGYVAYSRDGYCSCAPFYVNNYYWDSKCQVNNSTADLVIEGELTEEEVDNWIKARAPIQIVYPLKTSELVGTIDPQTLKSLRGINNIYSNTNDNITVKYWKH